MLLPEGRQRCLGFSVPPVQLLDGLVGQLGAVPTAGGILGLLDEVACAVKSPLVPGCLMVKQRPGKVRLRLAWVQPPLARHNVQRAGGLQLGATRIKYRVIKAQGNVGQTRFRLAAPCLHGPLNERDQHRG